MTENNRMENYARFMELVERIHGFVGLERFQTDPFLKLKTYPFEIKSLEGFTDTLGGIRGIGSGEVGNTLYFEFVYGESEARLQVTFDISYDEETGIITVNDAIANYILSTHDQMVVALTRSVVDVLTRQLMKHFGVEV